MAAGTAVLVVAVVGWLVDGVVAAVMVVVVADGWSGGGGGERWSA